jgi:hypothetical protein
VFYSAIGALLSEDTFRILGWIRCDVLLDTRLRMMLTNQHGSLLSLDDPLRTCFTEHPTFETYLPVDDLAWNEGVSLCFCCP